MKPSKTTPNEFELIQTYFSKQAFQRDDVIIGIGDDAAITSVPANHQLVTTTDTLIAGTHFPIDTPPYDIGHKALAVNLSDLAAMGATPSWFTLAITLPEANTAWLEDFSKGLATLAHQHHVTLIGGDTTRGNLSITIQAYGLVENGKALLRSSAKANDLIYISGELGDAGVALHNKSYPQHRLNQPTPRVSISQQIKSLANACIDISDGLIADLQHILTASNVGASIHINKIPLSKIMLETVSLNEAIKYALSSGDDYELCFTVSPENQAAIQSLQTNTILTCVGQITEDSKLKLLKTDGTELQSKLTGFIHF